MDDFILNLNEANTFESVFSIDISYVLADFMTVEEIFMKFAVLNKNFKTISG